MTPITLLLVVVVVFGEVTPPINCAFRSGRMHDSFFCQTLHINCTKRGLAMHQQGFHSRRLIPLAAQQLTDVASRLCPHLTCDHRRQLQEWQQLISVLFSSAPAT
jgi:hypothetical protein